MPRAADLRIRPRDQWDRRFIDQGKCYLGVSPHEKKVEELRNAECTYQPV
jgi:hypothetical protein